LKYGQKTVDVYSSEKEQIAALRKWWNNNGKAIIVGVVIGTGALVGWQSWQIRTRTAAEATSSQYEQLLAQVGMEQDDVALEIGKALVTDARQAGYKALARLYIAGIEAEQGNADAAKAQLQQIIDQPPMPEMELLARSRMARLLLGQGDTSQALSMLDVPDSGGFTTSYNMLRGDILISAGDKEGARTAWLETLAALDTRSPLRPIVLTKLEDLGTPERINE